jgi:hypothetical protein
MSVAHSTWKSLDTSEWYVVAVWARNRKLPLAVIMTAGGDMHEPRRCCVQDGSRRAPEADLMGRGEMQQDETGREGKRGEETRRDETRRDEVGRLTVMSL